VAEEARLAREALVDTLSTFDDKVMERFLEHDSSLEGVPADMIAQVIKSLFVCALVCDAARRNPATCGANQGAEKDDLLPAGGARGHHCPGATSRQLFRLRV
jgi:hypothetical protein